MNGVLEAIFYPENPLHDGAVLIRANQIVSVENVLPLTAAVISRKKLGTRHRASLGLSGETGKVSFVLDGKLYPVITAGSLPWLI